MTEHHTFYAWIEGLTSSTFQQSNYPYHVSQIYIQLLALSLLIIPLFIITLIFHFFFWCAVKIKSNRTTASKILWYIRGFFFVLLVLVVAFTIGIVCGSLFPWFNAQTWPILIGLSSVSLFFVTTYLSILCCCQPDPEEEYSRYSAELDAFSQREESERFLPGAAKPSKCSISRKDAAIMVGLVGLALVITFVTTGPCISIEPTRWSSQLTRMFDAFHPAATCSTSKSSPCYIYLTLPEQGSTSMNIHWITSFEYTDGAVLYYGLDDNVTWQANQTMSLRLKNVFVNRITHSVRLTGLEPNTKYFFRLGGDQQLSEIRFFYTLPTDNNFTFIAGGDIGTEPNAVQLMKDAMTYNPAFIIIGGDFAYANSICSCYHIWDLWFSLIGNKIRGTDGQMIPIIPAIGNHDAGGYKRSIEEVKFYFDFFPNLAGGNTNYTLSYHAHTLGKMRLLILDSDHVESSASTQRSWLDKELTEAVEAKMFIMTAYHMPLYPIREALLQNPLSSNVRNNWVPLFEQHNLDLSLEFHAHGYKRTKPIRAGNVHPNGTTYIGDGCMGVKPDITVSRDLWYMEKAEPLPHYLVLQVDDKKMSVKAIGLNFKEIDSVILPIKN